MPVCCECCVLLGRGLCDELITRSEEFYRVWCVVCDLETSWMRKPRPTGGCCPPPKKNPVKCSCQKPLIINFLPRSPAFDPRSLYVRFMLDRMIPGHIFLRLLLFSLLSIFPPLLHTIFVTCRSYH
jgi:hypothetical protein